MFQYYLKRVLFAINQNKIFFIAPLLILIGTLVYKSEKLFNYSEYTIEAAIGFKTTDKESAKHLLKIFNQFAQDQQSILNDVNKKMDKDLLQSIEWDRLKNEIRFSSKTIDDSVHLSVKITTSKKQKGIEIVNIISDEIVKLNSINDLKKYKNNYSENLIKNIDETRSKIRYLEKRIKKSRNLQNFERNKKIIEKLKNRANRYQDELNVNEQFDLSLGASIINKAHVKNQKTVSPKNQNQNITSTILIFIISIFIIIFIIILVDVLGQTLHSEYQTAKYLTIDVIGTLPLLPETDKKTKRAHNYKFQGDIKSIIHEHNIKRIHNYIDVKNEGNKKLSILITSPEPNEGKSLFANAIAGVIASETGKNVIIVDWHWLHPSIHKFYKVNPCNVNAGEFYNTMKDSINFSRIPDTLIQNTTIESVDTICAPKIDSSEKDSDIIKNITTSDLRNFLELLHDKYPYVIFDSSPIFPTEDILIDPVGLASLVDRTILLLLIRRTKKIFAKRSEVLLKGVSKQLDAVVNYHNNRI